jgi:hypothetical protein
MVTTGPCSTGHPGYSATYWNPYDNFTAAQVRRDLTYQYGVHDTGIVVDYAVDQEANAAWYPNTVGYNQFAATIPTLLSEVRPGAPLWMGLIVSPDLFAANETSWGFLESEVPKFEHVADDLYRNYGTRITGWLIPTEPDQKVVATYDLSYQYGAWLRQIDDYLHTHDGNKRVMIAPGMPSAIYAGLTPSQFVHEMQPMMAVAHMDIWNLQDGFGMTAWTSAQEAQGFALANYYAAQVGATTWADVYTPSSSTPDQWEPYLRAIASAGTSTLSQWTFPDYMDPSNTGSNANAGADYNAYKRYCNG